MSFRYVSAIITNMSDYKFTKASPDCNNWYEYGRHYDSGTILSRFSIGWPRESNYRRLTDESDYEAIFDVDLTQETTKTAWNSVLTESGRINTGENNYLTIAMMGYCRSMKFYYTFG